MRKFKKTHIALLFSLMLIAGTAQAGMPELELFRHPVPNGVKYENLNTVYEVFAFTCPHCRDNDPLFDQWSRTLPGSIQYEQIPVVTPHRSTLLLARAYYAAMEAVPERLTLMKKILFNLGTGQDQSKLISENTYFAAAKQSGMDIKRFASAWNSTAVRNRMLRAAHIIRTYRIRQVPTLILGGEYVISPSMTEGDMSTFIKLANGIISLQCGEKAK
ncbi:thiol:disulfide interchange protein DsbA [Desulfacinum hydrothermale DSM 13146]|uniref:Thiol:disulfide interchange protein DsbA n=1 Tax=Desulfacinum hydrothermale DSM 13146 TaxID=1121390 RepID=A0A1W1XXB0_9BACT|nr:thiol:disulfide interchange protein DsbA/DsbL [Desulfacinum hydrothermale]SMC28484.1 thiol:disulfide interchange protein DsbA [Desulfacinum hydrothermale DSM 13146]